MLPFATLLSLKRLQLSKAEEAHTAEVGRIMQENVSLIKEINDLRKELKVSRQEGKQLKGTLKTTRTLAQMRGQTLPTKEETRKMAGVTQATLREAYEAEQTDRIIDMQKQTAFIHRQTQLQRLLFRMQYVMQEFS